MSETKFTPGPWEAEPNTGRGAWVKGANGEWSALSCGNTDETAKANARLISAAPEMFSALSDLDAYWADTFPEGPDGNCSYYGIGHMADECKDLWRSIRAALSKASGKGE